MIKKLIIFFLGIAVMVPALAQAQVTTVGGGTGTTSPSGILYGDGTLHLKTVGIGSNLTFINGLLSATGGGSSQWTTLGNAIYNNTGQSVGINTQTPSAALEVEATSSAPIFIGWDSSLNNRFQINSTGGFTTYASSTIGNGTQTGGLTISGGATTTNLVVSTGGNTITVTPASIISNTNLNITGNTLVFNNAYGVGSVSFGGQAAGAPAFKNLSGASVTVPVFVPDGSDATTGFAAGTLGNINAIVGGKEILRITNTGLGLGTTSPYAQLSILATSTTGIGSPQFLFAVASTTGGTSTSTLFSIDNTGSVFISKNVGIGTAALTGNSITTSAKIVSGSTFAAANGSAAFPGFSFLSQTSGMFSPSAGIVGFSSGGSEVARFTAAGNLGLGTTTPFGKLAINLNSLDAAYPGNNAFIIASSTASATTTLFSVDNTGAASTTSLFGAMLSSCNSASNALTWNAGNFGCNTISGGSTFPFTPVSYGNATGTLIGFTGGILSVGSTTIVGNATTTGMHAFGNVRIPSLGVGAGSFIAVDPNGVIIATTTPSGSNSAFSPAANYATVAGLPSYTATGGVITEVGTGALSVDGNNPTVGQIVLVKNESGSCTSSAGTCQNGLYNVTAVGSGIAAFVLTRNSNYNSSSNLIPGIITYIISGTVNNDDFWALTTPAPITVGTTGLTYVEVSGGGAAVTSVSNSDSTLTISPTAGAVVASLNLAHSNTWSVLQNFGNATTSLFSTNYASSTLYFGANLASCNSASNALTWNGGTFGCNTISSATFTYPFPAGATSSPLMLLASTTIGNGTVTSGLTVSGTASTTNFINTSITSALGLFNAQHQETAYAGASACGANNWVTTISAVGGTTCGTIGANGLTLSMFPTIGANTVIGNLTGATATPTAFATSSLFTIGAGLTQNANTLGLTVPVTVTNGGTGIQTATVSQLLYGNGTAAFSSVATSSTGTLKSILALDAIGNSTIVFASTTALSSSGSAYFNTGNGGAVGIGTTSPFATLSVSLLNPTAGNTPLFAVASSSTGSLNTGLFSVLAGGQITLSETRPATSTTMVLDWSATARQVNYRIGGSATTISIINATTSTFVGSTKLVWICNPSFAAGALTWVGVEWMGATTPTQTTTANACDVYSFNITSGTSTTASPSYKVAGSAGTGFQ